MMRFIDLLKEKFTEKKMFSRKLTIFTLSVLLGCSFVSNTKILSANETDKLPRVLIIGDSISIGYTPHVKQLLKGIADVHHNPGNAQHTGTGLKKLDNWLGDTDWDVIHFNWGLWDLCYRNPQAKTQGNRDKISGTVTYTLTQYESNLAQLVKRLQDTNAKLIFATTTPVPEGEAGRLKGDEIEYNNVALKIMQRNNIKVNDLYCHALLKIPDIQTAPNNVHYTSEGYAYLAKQVADGILQVIDEPGHAELSEPPFPGTKSIWHDYDKYDFSIDGRNCCVVSPKTPAPGKPWIWRARFFGHEPQTDLALLDRGFHLAYIDVADLFGSPQAVKHWNAFYYYLTKKHALSPKPALEGMSRGGLIVYNWAGANPDKVACIYADAPVCDFKSWPAGQGKFDGHQPSWQACLEAYGLTHEQALEYKHNPIDNLEPLAQAVVPLLHVCGAADNVVPPDENTKILQHRYEKLGGNIKVISKDGVGHHPHSLKDPKPIVEFILAHTIHADKFHIALREIPANSRIRFSNEKKGRVAFLGGSITEMQGWRSLVGEMLQARFPSTRFDFINAGIASTDSTLGAFRLATDIFSRGPVDLLFVEYAVNDLNNHRDARERIRGMEGIIRHARQINPEIDIVMLYFIDPSYMPIFNDGKIPEVIADHEKVVQYYNIPSINLAREVTERINAGQFEWQLFRDLHPSPFGHRLYARTIKHLLDTAWNKTLTAQDQIQPHYVPEQPLDPFNYSRGRYLDLNQAEIVNGWLHVSSWTAKSGSTRKQFVNIPLLTTETPGAALKLNFSGTAIGLLVIAGPDVGIIEYSIDNGPLKKLDLFTRWSSHLHIPWAYILDAELESGTHVLILRTTDRKNKQSHGFSSRIVKFLAN
jgi:lysophospholipase L1-like esterase